MTNSSSRTLRVATWNIHACKGMDFRVDPERTLSVIDTLDADLIALQEVPTHSRDPALRALLEGDRGYHCLVETTLPERAEGFGNALLSRLSVRAAGRIDLACSGREPRCAIAAEIAVNDTFTLHVTTTHLGLREHERLEQLRRIEARLAEHDRPNLVMGDFNTWRQWPADRLADLQCHAVARQPATFPAFAPVLGVDRIMASPTLSLSGLRSWRAPGQRMASDHLPLIANIAVPRQA